MEDVPIGSITNGVHAPTWVAPEMGRLYERHLGESWREEADCARIWQRAVEIPDDALWSTHEFLRARLVYATRKHLRAQMQAQGCRAQELALAETVLDPHTLTIGFARRFATYKRARLIMQDLESLTRVVSDKERPVQFIFAGKAHPQDQGGKQLMKDIINLCRQAPFRSKMVFLEDYDMDLARTMISGCDVWLNNPRRPLEACGTSGMKAMFNCALQFSTLDGWWDEAWRPDNGLGWAIGKGEDYDDPDYQDAVELQTLYKVLESEIIPDFYDRDVSGLPRVWVRRMKDALAEFGPRFHSHRMVQDYLKTAYIPACAGAHGLYRDNFAPARELSAWRMNIMTRWGGLRVTDVETLGGVDPLLVGTSVTVRAKVHLADIPPEHLRLEICLGPLGTDDAFIDRHLSLMHPVGGPDNGIQTWEGSFRPKETGRFGFTVRAMPAHPLLPAANSLGLLRWAE